MSCLSCCHYITRASLTDNTTPSSSTSHQASNSNKPPVPKTKPSKIPRKSQQQMPLPMQKQDKSKQHSVMQIERAISAGTFRDAEPKDKSDFWDKKSIGSAFPDKLRKIHFGLWLNSFSEEALCKDLDQEKITYNGILPDLSGMFEGPVEKQIRETGEWFAKNSEERLRSSRKGILMVVFKWILPMWTLSLLIASGVIKLPFSMPFLDDLIM